MALKLLASFTLLLIISCAQSPTATTREMKIEEGAEAQDKGQGEEAQKLGEHRDEKKENLELTIEEATARLDKLAAEAKEAGEHAVNYLATDLYLKASTASMGGDFTTSAVLYKYLIGLRPNDSFLKFKYAVELIRLGKIEDARPYLEDVYKTSKHQDEKAGLILAGVEAATNEINKAIKIYRQILARNPDSSDACLLLAKSHTLQKNLNLAYQELDKCSKRKKGDAVFAFYKGKLALEANKAEQAKKFFEQALKIDPNYLQAALVLAQIQEDKQNLNGAMKIYKNVLLKEPGNVYALTKLVQILFTQEKYKEIIPYAEVLLKVDPSNTNLKIKLGILYTEAKKYSEAIEIFKGLVEEVPDNDKILYYLGALYQETNDFESAIKYYSMIPQTSSLFADSSLQTAHILNSMALVMEEGKESHKNRLFHFLAEKVEQLPELKVELMMVKANYYENTNDLNTAVEIMREVRTEKGFNESHDYYLATLLEKTQNFDEASRIVWALIEKNPKNAHAWNFLGYSLVERNIELDKAYEYISKALELKPDDGFIRDSLGWYYFKRGDTKRALQELKKARQKVADDVVISKHLAEVYMAERKFDKAKQFYLEALKNSRLESDRIEVLKSMEQLSGDRTPASIDFIHPEK